MAKLFPWREIDRKLWLLPLLAIATALAVLVPTEIILRTYYPDQEIDRCVVTNVAAPYAKPGCISHVKVAEGPWTENKYNDCGYRSPLSCSAAPAGSLRIAVSGSSMGAGTFVPEPESLSGRLPTALQRVCGRAVESQNLALPDFPVAQMAATAAKALALNPDVLLITVSSFDLEKPTPKGPAREEPLFRVFMDKIQEPFKNSTTVYMAKNLYLSNEKNYDSFIAAQRPADSSPLTSTPSGIPLLTEQVDQIVKSNTRRIPIVLMFMPRREEVTRQRVWPNYKDPAATALERVAQSHAIGYINGLQSIPSDIATASLYYVANHHMNGAGDAYMAGAAMRGILEYAPAFATCRRT